MYGDRITTLAVRPALPSVVLAHLLSLLLSLALPFIASRTAYAQAVPTITVEEVRRPGETNVPVGATAVFRLTRSGDRSGDISVRLQTINPGDQVGFGTNPSEMIHTVHFPPGVKEAEVRFPALGGRSYMGEIEGQVIQGVDYQLGDPGTNMADVELREATDDDVIVSIGPVSATVAERDGAVFRVTRWEVSPV